MIINKVKRKTKQKRKSWKKSSLENVISKKGQKKRKRSI